MVLKDNFKGEKKGSFLFLPRCKRVRRISNNISALKKKFLGKQKLTQEEIKNTNR